MNLNGFVLVSVEEGRDQFGSVVDFGRIFSEDPDQRRFRFGFVEFF